MSKNNLLKKIILCGELMKKALIAYYSFGEVEKVAQRIQKNLMEKKINSELFKIETKNNITLKEQFKKEKELELKNPVPFLTNFDTVFIGSPVVSFSSAPIVNVFLKKIIEEDFSGKKIYLYATGIGLPGSTIKKMRGILAMKGINPISDKVFSSIFHFDEKKLKEVDEFLKQTKIW